MIQKLPTLLQELNATTQDEWAQQTWYYMWRDYDVVPWVFDEDGCEDMLREEVIKKIRYEYMPYHDRFIPQSVIVVDVTACQDWEPDYQKPLTVRLKTEDGRASKSFGLRPHPFAEEIGPKGNKRVFYIFELEEIE